MLTLESIWVHFVNVYKYTNVRWLLANAQNAKIQISWGLYNKVSVLLIFLRVFCCDVTMYEVLDICVVTCCYPPWYWSHVMLFYEWDSLEMIVFYCWCHIFRSDLTTRQCSWSLHRESSSKISAWAVKQFSCCCGFDVERHEERGHSHSESADIRCAAGMLTLCVLFLWHLGKDRLIYMFERAHMLQQKDNVDLSLSFCRVISLSFITNSTYVIYLCSTFSSCTTSPQDQPLCCHRNQANLAPAGGW